MIDIFLFLKLRLMRSELNVEEVVQQRSLKVSFLLLVYSISI